MLERRAFIGLGIGALMLAGCSQTASNQGASSTSSTSKANNETSKQPAYDETGTLTEPLDNGYTKGLHTATIEVENLGTIELELNATLAPITVSNFADLAEHQFYDGLTFHRIIKNFMVQGGDPKDDGTGGAARTIKGEFQANGVVNVIKHERGVISMARAQAYNSASSQFFIMHQTNASLDGQYAAFGHVTKGMEIIDALAETPVTDANGTVDKSKQPKIVSVRMTS